MNLPSQSDSPPPSPSDGTVTRAAAGQDTAQPALTSGFGSVMERELELQALTEGCLGGANGQHAAEIVRVLHDQQARLGANIALLEQRYEMLPFPERFRTMREKLAEERPIDAVEASIALLPALIAQHLGVLAQIDRLITEGSDGQRGELILKEVARSHEEMAWVLTALVKGDAPAVPAVVPAEQNWENEGGGPDATPSHWSHFTIAPAKPIAG